MIDVVGGTYEEVCRFPSWHQFFGSGGRAAAAIQTLGGQVRLHTFSQDDARERRKALADAYGFDVNIQGGAPEVLFEYFHALRPLHYTPSFEPLAESGRQLSVVGKRILRFGMLEGEGVVKARRCVYDPQAPAAPQPFHKNGSTADELAIVCNVGEAEQLCGERGPQKCAEKLARQSTVAVVKAGAAGAWLCQQGSTTVIPSFRTSNVFPIGSGDVYSAAFAKAWLEDGLNPVAAASFASEATAIYCSSATLPTADAIAQESSKLQAGQILTSLEPRPLVYLAGPFFTMSQVWLIEEAREELRHAGMDVFSPFHEVGVGRPQEETARLDLEGLERADVVFAVLEGLDPGTLFEVGYATKKGTPVVCFVRDVKQSDLTMYAGTGAHISSDFASAIYATAWAGFASL